MRIGETLPGRTVTHPNGMALVNVGGHYGCYVRVQPTEDLVGSKAKDSMLLLTPAEARELAYHLRATADVVDQGRHELGLYR